MHPNAKVGGGGCFPKGLSVEGGPFGVIQMDSKGEVRVVNIIKNSMIKVNKSCWLFTAIFQPATSWHPALGFNIILYHCSRHCSLQFSEKENNFRFLRLISIIVWSKIFSFVLESKPGTFCDIFKSIMRTISFEASKYEKGAQWRIFFLLSSYLKTWKSRCLLQLYFWHVCHLN